MSSAPADARARDVREQFVSVLVFLKRAARFWVVPLGAIIVGGVVAGVLLYLRQPTYRSETVILYSLAAGSADAAAQSTGVRSITTRLRELLMSRPKLAGVVAEFGLYPEVPRADGLDELKKHVEFRAPGGDTFSIAFEGTSPSQARRVTTRLSQLVIDEEAGLRKKQASVARDFLVTEKGKTEARLREAELELAGFMAKHPRFALDAASFTTGAAIRANLGSGTSGEAATAPARGFRPGSVGPRGVRAPDAGAATNRESVADANSEGARASAALVAAQANLAEQLERYTEAHPDVRAAAVAVERSNARLDALPKDSVSRASSTVPPVANGTRGQAKGRGAFSPPRRVAPIARGGDAAVGSDRDVVVVETLWSRLTRGVTEARQRQDQVEAQLFKADILASSESGGHGLLMTVIDPAFLPVHAVPPGRSLIAAIVLSLSLVLGMFGALLCVLLDDRIYERRDVGAIAEVLVEIPR